MKLISSLLLLAAPAAAFVVPDQRITEQLTFENQRETRPFVDRLHDGVENLRSGVGDSFKHAVTFSDNALDSAINAATDAANRAKLTMQKQKWDSLAWLDSDVETFEEHDVDPDKPHRKPHHGKPPSPDKTLYELIASSNDGKILTKLINKYSDLVETLNSTAANHTIFAPTDKAFKQHPWPEKFPKELVKDILTYHISSGVYSTRRLLLSHTIPTNLHEDSLGDNAQRLRISRSLWGLRLNFFSRIVAGNIQATNGILHAVDSIFVPPPPALQIIELFPTEFSTFQLGLTKTGLDNAVAESYHEGGTIFAPSNFAFKRLGLKVNALLFSKHGEKYLKALLKYHIVANHTLYSDAFYKAKAVGREAITVADEARIESFHVNLPTLLEERSLSVDIASHGPFVNIRINGYNDVAVQDGIAKDGVVHTLNRVLIPPKRPGGSRDTGEEMSVEEFKARFDPYVEEL